MFKRQHAPATTVTQAEEHGSMPLHRTRRARRQHAKTEQSVEQLVHAIRVTLVVEIGSVDPHIHSATRQRALTVSSAELRALATMGTTAVVRGREVAHTRIV